MSTQSTPHEGGTRGPSQPSARQDSAGGDQSGPAPFSPNSPQAQRITSSPGTPSNLPSHSNPKSPATTSPGQPNERSPTTKSSATISSPTQSSLMNLNTKYENINDLKGRPYICVKSYVAREQHKDKEISINEGEKGKITEVHRYDSGKVMVKITLPWRDGPDKARRGWVPRECVKAGTGTYGEPTCVGGVAPSPASC